MLVSRRTALMGLTAGAGALASPNVLRAQANLQLKCGNNMPATHPVNTRLQEAFKRIAERTSGKVQIQLFPNSQLGADDSMLGQLRAGGLEFHIQSGLVVSSLVPVAALNGVGFVDTFQPLCYAVRQWTVRSARISSTDFPRPTSWPSTRSGTTGFVR